MKHTSTREILEAAVDWERVARILASHYSEVLTSEGLSGATPDECLSGVVEWVQQNPADLEREAKETDDRG